MIAQDVWGDWWIVKDTRPTQHGFLILLGRPYDIINDRPLQQGGTRVIITPELAVLAESHRYDRTMLKLPISRTAQKRVRRLLGINRYVEAAKWWEERVSDLASLTIEEFAARYGRKVSAVERARLALVGRALRPQFWWASPDVAAILRSLPTANAADKLGISAVYVRNLRTRLSSAESDQ